MKKLVVLALVLLALTGCTNSNGGNGQQGASKDVEVVQIYKRPYAELLSDDVQSELYNNGLMMEDNEFAVLGEKLDGYKFTTTDGETVSLPQNKAYVLEVVGSWCGYCQALTGAVVEKEIYSKIPVYQYFMYGNKEDVQGFYDAAGLVKPDEIVAFVENEEFEMFLQDHEFYSVPLTIVVNDEGKIAMTHLGYIDADPYMNFINYALNAKFYDVQKDGVSLQKFIKRQEAIRNYINSLEEIAVPKDLLD